jgi:hypothetical protein
MQNMQNMQKIHLLKYNEELDHSYYNKKKALYREIYASLVQSVMLLPGDHFEINSDNEGNLVLTATEIKSLFLERRGAKNMGATNMGAKYDEIETMAIQLSHQLGLMEKHGFTLLFWQPADIICINQTYYFLANLQNLVPLNKNNKTQLILAYPVEKMESEITAASAMQFIAPELQSINQLPFLTHRAASYYSLGLLCLNASFQSLEELQGTKLFYFIERCLRKDPATRVCFYV